VDVDDSVVVDEEALSVAAGVLELHADIRSDTMSSITNTSFKFLFLNI
jgi:hypothetical protein